MPTLTASASFTIGAGSPDVEEITLDILPAAVGGAGLGRLVHPTLGTYDYSMSPSQWNGIDTDVVVPPVWASTKTLSGAANTLWRGSVRDAVCVERWGTDAGVSMPADMFRMLLAFWQNPPDPANGFIEWWPSYTSAFGYKVILLDFKAGGGQGINLDTVMNQGYVVGPAELTLRVVERL